MEDDPGDGSQDLQKQVSLARECWSEDVETEACLGRRTERCVLSHKERGSSVKDLAAQKFAGRHAEKCDWMFSLCKECGSDKLDTGEWSGRIMAMSNWTYLRSVEWIA